MGKNGLFEFLNMPKSIDITYFCDIINKLIILKGLKEMSVKVEKTENKNEVKLSFEIEAAKFEEAMKKVYMMRLLRKIK